MAARQKRVSTTGSYQQFELELSLADYEPRIWRRVLVPSSMTLGALHFLIQLLFSWLAYHLHAFETADAVYGDPSVDEDAPKEQRDERQVRLDALLTRAGERMRYLYDFGDDWKIEIELRADEPLTPSRPLPLCVGGERAAPPEDCGGVGGFENLVATVRGRQSEERDELMVWLGGDFDPDGFDRNAVNRRLRRAPESLWPPPKRRR